MDSTEPLSDSEQEMIGRRQYITDCTEIHAKQRVMEECFERYPQMEWPSTFE